MNDDALTAVLRASAPKVLGPLVRRYGDLARCEDAVQEALIAAAQTWTSIPEHPVGWLTTVATRRYIDQIRADSARTRREAATVREPEGETPRDDLLELLFLCCHPVLKPPAQLALTLRAVAGLTTEEIAAAFLVSAKTMGQRISRAKLALKGERFELPADLEQRLPVVLHVLYLMFNEGYSASGGDQLHRPELTRQALALTRRLHDDLPQQGEVAGLLALMVLTEARAAARTRPDGALVPLEEQDRSLWDRAAIAEGTDLITTTMASRPLGPYQIQAAIAALHVEDEPTDWRQILVLYDVLERISPNPVTALNRAVALAMVRGSEAGLGILRNLENDLPGNRRLHAVRAHLLDRAGRSAEAAAAYDRAAELAGSVPEQRFLKERAEICRKA